LIGWLDESNVNCIDAKTLTRKAVSLKLSPLSSRSDTDRFIFVKTGSYTGVAIEVRTRGGLNTFPASWQGPLVYKIDTRKKSNEGAASLVGPGSPRFNGLSIGTLKPGQQVVSGGIKVRFKSQAGKVYKIEVSR
jgi:hypothetical protein